MYGLCLFIGIALAVLVGERLCKRKNLDLQVYWKAVFYTLIFGFLGARFYHVIHRFDYFVQHLVEVFAVWQGGLGIWGGVFGGLLGLYVSTKKTGKLLEYADIFAIVTPLAQAIGRWGNFFNNELFGYPTNLPWGIFIPQELRPAAFKYYDHFHPLFLYESILNLLLFVFLYKTYGQGKVLGVRVSLGTLTMLYLIGYSLIRLALELMRVDPWKFAGIPTAILIALITSIICVLLLALSYRRKHNL